MEETPGVAAEANAPVEDASPASTGEEPTQEASSEESLPFGKHPRWIKMNEENRGLRGKVKEFEGTQEQYQGAIALDQILRQNPEKMAGVMEILTGKPAQKEPEDPYGEYDPDVANKFREFDEIKQWKQDVESQHEEAAKRSVEENKSVLDQEFESMLVADNFVDAEGKAVDDNFVDLISNATLSALQNNAQNPDRPTRAELTMAYKTVKEGIEYLKKSALKDVVKPSIPLSGTAKGQIPPQNAEETEEQRLASIAEML